MLNILDMQDLQNAEVTGVILGLILSSNCKVGKSRIEAGTWIVINSILGFTLSL